MSFGQWIGLLALVIALYILWQIRQVLLLVFAAVLLATLLNRLARRLQRFGMQRTAAVLLAIGLVLTVAAIFFWLIVPPFIAQFKELTTQKLPQVLLLLDDWENQLKTRIPSVLLPYLPDVSTLPDQLQPLLNRLLGRSFAFVSGSLGVVLDFLLVVILTLMMLVHPQSYRKLFIRLFPSFYRRRVDDILKECEISLGAWFSGASISMSVIALLSWLGLTILGVRLALASGILAGLLNFIPNIGPTLSVVLPMAIAVLDAPWKSIAVLILYILIQQFESNLLTPFVMAQQVSLLPAMTLLSQVFFTTAFGSLGLLLSIPLTVVSQIWLKEALIEDILDRWGSDAETETELVIVSDSAEPVESSAVAESSTIDEPAISDEDDAPLKK